MYVCMSRVLWLLLLVLLQKEKGKEREVNEKEKYPVQTKNFERMERLDGRSKRCTVFLLFLPLLFLKSNQDEG